MCELGNTFQARLPPGSSVVSERLRRRRKLATDNAEAPDLTFSLPLELNRDRTWGRRPDAPDRIEDCVILGKPLVRPITRERFGDDAEMHPFLPSTVKTPEFYYVTFSCTFTLPRPLRFESAWIRVVLESADTIEPVARKISHDVTTSTSTISGEVKAGTGPLVASRSQTDTRKDLTITARNEGTSFPEW